MTNRTVIEDNLVVGTNEGTSGSMDLIVPLSRPASPDSCDWLPRAKRQLRAIRNLRRGWDSHGSPPPNGLLLDAAEALLEALCSSAPIPAPHVNPTPSGVQFEWESGSRYFEVEIVGEGAASWFYQDTAAGEEREGELFVGEQVTPLVHRIHQIAASQ